MKYSFAPIVDKNCVILILGTIPGEESLRQQQYYAHPRNQFWKLIYSQFHEPVDDDYNQRKTFLLKHNIAVWDCLHSAEREGSLDSDIKNAIPNDFTTFFSKYPNIQFIFFNGGTAESLFKRYFKLIYQSMQNEKLPSSSPTNTKTLEIKQAGWMIIRKKIDEIINVTND